MNKLQERSPFWKRLAAKAQVDVSLAAYTKVPMHWKDTDFVPEYNKIYYITEGQGFLKLDDQLYYPQPGEMYLLPAGRLQSYGTLNDNTFGKYWCHFTAKVNDLPLFKLLEVPICIKVGDPELLRSRFEQLIEQAKSSSLASEFRVNANLFELIALFLEQHSEVSWNMKASSSFEKMSVVLQHIEKNLQRNISVDELAQLTHFHPNYFIPLFKQFSGFSPIQYMNRRRIDKAKNRLTATDLTVTEIADEIGLEPAYFSRLFKEHTGLSPTAFREMVT